jgi:hypothetical protein
MLRVNKIARVFQILQLLDIDSRIFTEAHSQRILRLMAEERRNGTAGYGSLANATFSAIAAAGLARRTATLRAKPKAKAPGDEH